MIRQEVETVLPKQWRHWCRQNGLTVPGANWARKNWAWFNLNGCGHVWRINCFGEFQLGDSLEEFDRWALCSNIISRPVPKTKAEFDEAVYSMLKARAEAEFFDEIVPVLAESLKKSY